MSPDESGNPDQSGNPDPEGNPDPDYRAEWKHNGNPIVVEIYCDQLPPGTDCFKAFAQAVKDKHDDFPAN